MKIVNLHSWPKKFDEALVLQRSLTDQIDLKTRPQARLKLIAGGDVSATIRAEEIWAAVVVMKLPELKVVEKVYASAKADFPYIPGLLSFRELPVLIKAFRKLKYQPDCVICDGQGLAHPRFLGLACHLGLWLKMPTIGCAKSVLVGEAPEPKSEAGSYTPLVYKGKTVGAVLRTRTDAKPVYVSPGHLIDIEKARQVALMCCDGKRLPEPTRLAHLEVNNYRKQNSK